MADVFFGADVTMTGDVGDVPGRLVGSSLFNISQKYDLLERMMADVAAAEGRSPIEIAITQLDIYRGMLQSWVASASGIFGDVDQVGIAVLGSMPVLCIDLKPPDGQASRFAVTIPFNEGVKTFAQRVLYLYEVYERQLNKKSSAQAREGGSAYRGSTSVADCVEGSSPE